jgi:hypothetical protein
LVETDKRTNIRTDGRIERQAAEFFGSSNKWGRDEVTGKQTYSELAPIKRREEKTFFPRKFDEADGMFDKS